MAELTGNGIIEIGPYMGGVADRVTDYQAQLFTPLKARNIDAGRALIEKRATVYLHNGTDVNDSISSVAMTGDSAGILTDTSTPLTIPARSSQRVVISIVYGGPAIYHAVVTFTAASGEAPVITIEGTRADPYGISIEVGATPDTLAIRGGIIYGWPDAGVVITLPFSLVQGTEYFIEFAWNHTTGDHSVFIDGVLVGLVNVPTTTEGIVNRIVPGTNSYSNPTVESTQIFDNIVMSTDENRHLSTLSSCPRHE